MVQNSAEHFPYQCTPDVSIGAFVLSEPSSVPSDLKVQKQATSSICQN